MLFCEDKFECISNSIVFYLKKHNMYPTKIKKENSSNFFLSNYKRKPNVSRTLTTFPTFSSEAYTLSRRVLMLVSETD